MVKQIDSKRLCSWLVVTLPLAFLSMSDAFQIFTNTYTGPTTIIVNERQQADLQNGTPLTYYSPRIEKMSLKMAMYEDNEEDLDDDDDDDDYIDDDSLGDWRTFRSSLVGNNVNAEETKTSDQGKIQDKDQISPNAELLRSQSETLGEEYLTGAWAHEAPDVEVGGLVIRLPLEAEIYRGREKNNIGKELKKRLDVEDESSNNASLLSLGINSNESSSPNLSLSMVGAQTLLWYKKAQKLIADEMAKIAESANENGEIDPRLLGQKGIEILELYLDNQNAWQEVCLVADRDSSEGTATTFVLNRPMAFSVRKDLARLILFGSSGVLTDRIPVSQTEQLVKFLSAFENQCAVYVGGPNKMEEPAVMIHGYGELEGAVEIAPGTKIYRGGVKAAVDGVLSGKYKPLDFRFFIGRYDYANGDLDIAVHLNKYQSIACARPIILKQCIQLPKPLWHEVLEFCGGELKVISKLELMKRDDLNEK